MAYIQSNCLSCSVGPCACEECGSFYKLMGVTSFSVESTYSYKTDTSGKESFELGFYGGKGKNGECSNKEKIIVKTVGDDAAVCGWASNICSIDTGFTYWAGCFEEPAYTALGLGLSIKKDIKNKCYFQLEAIGDIYYLGLFQSFGVTDEEGRNIIKIPIDEIFKTHSFKKLDENGSSATVTIKEETFI